MSTASRLTLHDCKVELRIPAAVSPLPETPESYALQAAANPNDLTECYIGSTIFLLLTLSPPTSPKVLLPATKSLSDLTVLLITPPTRESVRLPVLRESPWSCTASHLVKGIWALVRSPPSADDSHTLATGGKQNIVVSLRESTASPRNSSVWATIDRAGRLFAKSVTMKATRSVMLAMPMQVSCHAACVGGSADRTFVNVTVKNGTNDAYLSVVPPYINLLSSRIIRELERDPVGTAVHLEGEYEFIPMFESTAANEKEDDYFKRAESGASCEDYGLFIPSFNNLLQRAATLGPREVYNFAYKVTHKGPNTEAENESKERTTYRRLQAGQCVQTAVAVAWSCSKTEEEEDMEDEDVSLQRELSAGGLLATGQRGNVAVHMTSVNWKPGRLLGGMVVTVSGPQIATVGDTVQLSISVVNQTERALEKASVRIQAGQIEYDLLALRTVISVGRIVAGGETNLQLPCLALKSGAQGLGQIRVVDEGLEGRTVWVTDSEFKVVVLDEALQDAGTKDVEVATEALAKLVAR